MANRKRLAPVRRLPRNTAERLSILPDLLELPNDAEIVRRLGIVHSLWSNYLAGRALPAARATQLVRTFPGLSRDWLYDGNEAGLSGKLLDRLRKLFPH